MATPSAAVRRARRQWVTFGFLVVVSAGLMVMSDTGPAREVQSLFRFAFKPVVETLNNSVDAVGSFWGAFGNVERLQSENQQLQDENDTLRRQLARMPAIERLNDDWTAVTKYQEFVHYRTAPARVVIRNFADRQIRTVVIDRGSDDGMREDYIVIAAGGALVGRIDKVDRKFSEVRLINDARSLVTSKSISSLDPTHGSSGVVVGLPGGIVQMRDVAATETLTIGDQVVTDGSDLGDVRSLFPPALLIGRIIDVTRDPNAVVQTAYIQPDVDFQTMNYVLVITNYQGGVQDPSASPSAQALPTASQAASPKPSAKPSPSRKP